MSAIYIEWSDLIAADQHSVGCDGEARFQVVGRREAHMATVLVLLAWGHDEALSGLPMRHRKALALTLRELADLMDPGDES